jgi:hypothetical protein
LRFFGSDDEDGFFGPGLGAIFPVLRCSTVTRETRRDNFYRRLIILPRLRGLSGGFGLGGLFTAYDT